MTTTSAVKDGTYLWHLSYSYDAKHQRIFSSVIHLNS